MSELSGYNLREIAENLMEQAVDKDALDIGEGGVFAEDARMLRAAGIFILSHMPRLLHIDEVRLLPPESDIWLEVVRLDGKPHVRANTVAGVTENRLVVVAGAHDYALREYGQNWRAWLTRPPVELREATPWEKR